MLNDAKKRRVTKGTGAQLVYDILRGQILNLVREPGSILDETALVDEIGVSRTPVREAIIKLASEELITILPNRGAMVAPLNLSDFPRFLEAFDLLQRAVTRLAALRRTDAHIVEIDKTRLHFEDCARAADPLATTIANRNFHSAIGNAAGNRFLEDQYSRLLNLSMRYSRFPFGTETDNGNERGLEKHLARVVEDHRNMADAIRDKNAPRAEELGHDHTVLFRDRIKQYLDRNETNSIACDVSDTFSK